MPLIHWLQLSLTAGLGPVLTRRLVDAAGGAEAACAAGVALLRQVEGVGQAKAAAIAAALKASREQVGAEVACCRQLGVRLICPDDEEFPPMLRSIPDPPTVLYVRGDVQPRDLNGVAIVGSRKCSDYGREQAERFGALLAGAGFTVVSGGARGIDSSAHRGAMSHGLGRTIAVLGSGINVPYPPENAGLFDQIAAGRGAVVSEFPLGTPPARENFPRRNRVVSGMSRGVLVIEADERSGALITARQAIEDHDRVVFAVPGRVDNPLSAGPHKLLREGAVLCVNLDDVVQNLGPLPDDVARAGLIDAGALATRAEGDEGGASARPATDGGASVSGRAAAAVDVGLSDRQRQILAHLGTEPLHVDGLIARTSLEASAILQDLTLLSLKGVVKRVDGQSYVRRGDGR